MGRERGNLEGDARAALTAAAVEPAHHAGGLLGVDAQRLAAGDAIALVQDADAHLVLGTLEPLELDLDALFRHGRHFVSLRFEWLEAV